MTMQQETRPSGEPRTRAHREQEPRRPVSTDRGRAGSRSHDRQVSPGCGHARNCGICSSGSMGARAAEWACHRTGAREAVAGEREEAGAWQEAEAGVRSWLEAEARSLGRGQSRRQRARSVPELKQRARERRRRGHGQARDQK
jgi:hypothetical protein